MNESFRNTQNLKEFVSKLHNETGYGTSLGKSEMAENTDKTRKRSNTFGPSTSGTSGKPGQLDPHIYNLAEEQLEDNVTNTNPPIATSEDQVKSPKAKTPSAKNPKTPVQNKTTLNANATDFVPETEPGLLKTLTAGLNSFFDHFKDNEPPNPNVTREINPNLVAEERNGKSASTPAKAGNTTLGQFAGGARTPVSAIPKPFEGRPSIRTQNATPEVQGDVPQHQPIPTRKYTPQRFAKTGSTLFDFAFRQGLNTDQINWILDDLKAQGGKSNANNTETEAYNIAKQVWLNDELLVHYAYMLIDLGNSSEQEYQEEFDKRMKGDESLDHSFKSIESEASIQEIPIVNPVLPNLPKDPPPAAAPPLPKTIPTPVSNTGPAPVQKPLTAEQVLGGVVNNGVYYPSKFQQDSERVHGCNAPKGQEGTQLPDKQTPSKGNTLNRPIGSQPYPMPRFIPQQPRPVAPQPAVTTTQQVSNNLVNNNLPT